MRIDWYLLWVVLSSALAGLGFGLLLALVVNLVRKGRL